MCAQSKLARPGVKDQTACGDQRRAEVGDSLDLAVASRRHGPADLSGREVNCDQAAPGGFDTWLAVDLEHRASEYRIDVIAQTRTAAGQHEPCGAEVICHWRRAFLTLVAVADLAEPCDVDAIFDRYDQQAPLWIETRSRPVGTTGGERDRGSTHPGSVA